MRRISGCGAAVAAALSLAACSGGGDSVCERTPPLVEMRARTGLSTPPGTPGAAQARSLNIFPRADSLILSTMHGETGSAEIPAFRLLTQCGKTQCTLTEPLSGTVDPIELLNIPIRHGAASAIGSTHGITLVQESSVHTGADLASLGAWLEHSTFAIQNERQAGEEGTVDLLYGIAVGDLTGTLPGPIPGTATWSGIMVGAPVDGDARGERLVGDAALTYDFAFWVGSPGPSLRVAFGGIRNIDRGTAHTVETLLFENLAVAPDGTFARGQSGARIQGGLYGPGHAEAAGIFEQSGIVGAFGATRQ
ncbi:MAG: transferrin-binding protein-like solute binding protein [Rhodospirillales bacterium]|nr:transferrin-binding protein-like solute binding protein [Rhodospirillales bacterium]